MKFGLTCASVLQIRTAKCGQVGTGCLGFFGVRTGFDGDIPKIFSVGEISPKFGHALPEIR